MTKKDLFLRAVFQGALHRDLENDTHQLNTILFIASQIPEHSIPPHVENSASVLIAYCHGIGSEFRWMFERETIAPPPDNIVELKAITDHPLENAA